MAIGAERVGWDSYPDDQDFIVLADLDGNRFCIVDLRPRAGLTLPRKRIGERGAELTS